MNLKEKVSKIKHTIQKILTFFSQILQDNFYEILAVGFMVLLFSNFRQLEEIIVLPFEKMEITFGLSLALAGDDISVPMIPLTPSTEIDFIYEQQNAKISSTRIKFILGLTF